MVYTISFGFNTKSIKSVNKVYDKYTKHRAFLNYCRLYIFKVCEMWHAIFSRNILKRIALLSKRFWYYHSDI